MAIICWAEIYKQRNPRVCFRSWLDSLCTRMFEFFLRKNHEFQWNCWNLCLFRSLCILSSFTSLNCHWKLLFVFHPLHRPPFFLSHAIFLFRGQYFHFLQLNRKYSLGVKLLFLEMLIWNEEFPHLVHVYSTLFVIVRQAILMQHVLLFICRNRLERMTRKRVHL